MKGRTLCYDFGCCYEREERDESVAISTSEMYSSGGYFMFQVFLVLVNWTWFI